RARLQPRHGPRPRQQSGAAAAGPVRAGAARADWRTFRVDRIEPKTPTGPRFTPRELPEDAAEYVAKGVTSRAYRFQARIVLHAPVATVQQTWAGFGTVVPLDADTCELTTGFESLDALAMFVGMLGVDFEVREPPELADHLRVVAQRLSRAADLPRGTTPRPPG
ncbi:WYL domain-containing protein, partial [Actinacidiphila alni]|uniref:helix-turn-helix transcriptional regulator n=1 Tax=Actinacidiphila alni TaxID=380248 RepID=UPI00340AD08C